MPDLTTDGRASTPRGGVTGVALELLSSSARGAVKAPLSLLKLPLVGLQQMCSVAGAIGRTSFGIAERGLDLVGRRGGSTDDAGTDPRGYLTEPESRDGEYAEFSPEFASGFHSGALDVDPRMLADADADLIAELGTDLSVGLEPVPDADADVAAANLAAADLAASELGDTRLSTDDVEAAVADLTAAAADAASAPAPAQDVEPVDIVTRAAVAAEEAAADDSLPVVARDELPIEDFDHVTAGSLRGRLRRLGLPELRTLRTYEQEHGSRLPILTLLENRIAKLEAGATA
jgi:hypothetical protein